jgi:copper/silver efflux system protein
MPAFAHWLFARRPLRKNIGIVLNYLMIAGGLAIAVIWYPWAGIVLMAFGIHNSLQYHYPERIGKFSVWITAGISIIAVVWLLAGEWMPLGVNMSLLINFLFIGLIVALVLGLFSLFIRFYGHILSWCLENKIKFLLIPLFILLLAANMWLGFAGIFGFMARGGDSLGINIRTTSVWSGLTHTFPGMGKEFMPSLDEGSFLLMPTSMPHSGIEENRKILQQLDMLVTAIPEVEMVVGKAGRAETALDPAPMSMFENIINYKSEYITDINGNRLRFAVDSEGNFQRSDDGELIPDRRGRYYRQWRDHINSPDDIWNEIIMVANLPGVTSAPKLQPIETRLVMLQTGMRAPMGIKVFGPDLQTIEDFGRQIEVFLKEVPSVNPNAVFADRIVGKPYLEIDLDRVRMARYGLSIKDVQDYIEIAIGGMPLSTTVEGRERFPIRARYAREWRDDPEMIEGVLIPTPTGTQIPLGQISEIVYRQGPSMIRSEDSFLVGFVLLDKQPGFAEVSVVEDAQRYLQEKIDTGELVVPAGVNYYFSGSYENQIRAEKRLALVIPLSLIIIFLILFFQFRSTATALMIFSSIAMAFAGGFMMLWLYGQGWFMDFNVFGSNMRELFQMRTFNLSVAVWVGFIALFGIATDDGVVMGTYLKQSFERLKPENVKEIRKAVLEAGLKRVRPCLMTTATTLLALLPILTSTGRGADIMIPMAIPSFGGMTVALVTLLIVPVLYSMVAEYKAKQQSKNSSEINLQEL